MSTLVSSIVGSLIKWGGGLIQRLKGRLPDDHSALSRGGSAISSVSSNDDTLPVLVACAPSRRLRKTGLDPDTASSLVAKAFPGLFPDGPDYSSPLQGIRYQVNADTPTHYMRRRMWLNLEGRVDLYLTLDPVPLPGKEEVGLPLVEVLRPLLYLLFFIQSGDYDKLFRRQRHCVRRRFDWFFAVSGDVQQPEMRRASWIAQFPGRAARRAVSQPSFCPSEGFAAPELRGWSTKNSWEDISRIALKSLLVHNGYHEVSAAIDDTIAAAKLTLVPELQRGR